MEKGRLSKSRSAPRSRRERARAAQRQRRQAFMLLGVGLALAALVGAIVLFPAAKQLNTALHQHATLTIILNGASVAIPANIGIDSALWNDHTLDGFAEHPGSAAAVHTHDVEPNKLHVELNQWHPCTLGDFFNIWGQPFDANRCLGYTGPVSMTVDGKPSTEFRDLVLQDGQHIVLSSA